MPTRPNQWWVADFTYTQTLAGFVYYAFCVDVFWRRMLGWRVMSTKATPLVTSVLEKAAFTHRQTDFRFTTTGLAHHSDVGVNAPRYRSPTRYTTPGSPHRSVQLRRWHNRGLHPDRDAPQGPVPAGHHHQH